MYIWAAHTPFHIFCFCFFLLVYLEGSFFVLIIDKGMAIHMQYHDITTQQNKQINNNNKETTKQKNI